MRRKAGHQDVWHTRVRYTVCKELVTMSMTQAKQRTSNNLQLGAVQAADDVAVNMLVPIISRLLHETDENLQVLAVCALVNYTHNNTPMKNTVMASGAVRKVATFLSSHNEDLVRHSSALLRNCTKTPQYRQTVASYGVIRRLFSLLEESEAPPKFRPLPILVQAIAILGQLAYDQDIKQKITETLGFQPMAYTRTQTECPKVIVVLKKFLRPDQELGNQPVTDTRREALYFHVSRESSCCCFFLFLGSFHLVFCSLCLASFSHGVLITMFLSLCILFSQFPDDQHAKELGNSTHAKSFAHVCHIGRFNENFEKNTVNTSAGSYF